MGSFVGFRTLLKLTAPKSFARSLSAAVFLSSNRSTEVYRNDIVIRNIDENQQTPLMLMVGWSNSKNKQLAKYSEIYENRGFTTISVSCKLHHFAMFYDTLFADDSKACIDALSSQRSINKERKVFFKMFSAPGPAMYINIMNYYYQFIQGHFGTDRYQNPNLADIPKVSGVIFDSPTVACGDAQNFANSMKGDSKNPISNYIFDVLGKIMFAYAVRTSKMYQYGPEFLRNIPVLIPQLVLFSKADKIAGYEAILEYIEHQKSLGAIIDSHMWHDSPHVLHFRKYPHQYRQLVTSFVEEMLMATEFEAIPLAESKVYSVLERDNLGLSLTRKEKL